MTEQDVVVINVDGQKMLMAVYVTQAKKIYTVSVAKHVEHASDIISLYCLWC